MASAVSDNTGCCCMDLKTGSFIIGYLNLIGLLVLVFYIMIPIPIDGYGMIQYVPLAFILLALLFAILLLVGLHQNKPGLLLPYLIFSIILTAFVIFRVIMLCAHYSELVLENKPLVLIVHVLAILVSVYFIIVIKSMYIKMKNPPPASVMQYARDDVLEGGVDN